MDLFISVLLATFIIPCDAIYGEPCQLFLDTCDVGEVCKNGRCECDFITTLYYDASAVASCKRHTTNLNCKNETCKEDEVCGKYGQCICRNSSEVKVLGKCTEIRYQNAMEKCQVANNTAYFCSYENNSICSNGRCVCFESHFYNQSAKSCEPKENYNLLHGLSTYKARPKEYCRNRQDCIDGLRCLPQLLVCDCPRSCPYKSSEEICDCGLISFDFPTEATITGVILGILSVVLWAFLIYRTTKKYKKRRTDMNLSDLNAHQDPTNSNEASSKADVLGVGSPEKNTDSQPPLGFDRTSEPYMPL